VPREPVDVDATLVENLSLLALQRGSTAGETVDDVIRRGLGRADLGEVLTQVRTRSDFGAAAAEVLVAGEAQAVRLEQRAHRASAGR